MPPGSPMWCGSVLGSDNVQYIFAGYFRISLWGHQHMATDVDELTVDYTEDGQLVSKQLDKIILTKGAWSTILYRYQDWDRKKEDYGPEKYSIRRYQKRNGEYQQKSKFNISSRAQAEKIVDALQSWISKDDE